MSRRIRGFICGMCICMTAGAMFSGCSYREMENAARAKAAEIVPDKEENAGTGNAQTEDAQTENTESDVVRNPVYQIGDTAVWSSADGQTVEHTVTEVRTAETLEELGVAREDCESMARSWYIGEDGTALGAGMADRGDCRAGG